MDSRRLLNDSCSESSLSDSSSSSDLECAGSTWRWVPRYTAEDKGKAVAAQELNVRPWDTVQGNSDDECPAGSSPRSVQTAFSLAESIGYSTEFVLPAEGQVQETHMEAMSEGVTMSTILCWTTAITLLVAGSCYLVHSMVA